jgi:hypothetical protein
LARTWYINIQNDIIHCSKQYITIPTYNTFVKYITKNEEQERRTFKHGTSTERKACKPFDLYW